MSTFYGWILWSMVAFCPTRSLARFVEYQHIAAAIAHATHDADDAANLSSFGSLDSGFDVHARNRRTGARGVWQLMAPVPCRKLDLDCEAVEALRRLHVQGACGYTGERWTGDCPLARKRLDRATIWTAQHPWMGGS